MTSYTWTGTVTFTGATDPFSTNIATLTLTPSGGITNLPALVQGQPGLPPVLRNLNVVQYAAGVTPPASTYTLVSPGGAGSASTYDLNLNLNSGATGPAGTNATIATASDFSGTPGSGTDGYTLYYSYATGKFTLSPAKRIIGPFNVTSGSFAANYNGNLGQYVVATLGIAAQPYAWRPLVSGGLYVSGTANTHVDLLCRVGNATSGDVVGYGLGWTGAGPFPVQLQPAFQQAVGSTGTYGQIAANTNATLYLIAQQTASTTDNWQTASTNAYFTVSVVPS